MTLCPFRKEKLALSIRRTPMTPEVHWPLLGGQVPVTRPGLCLLYSEPSQVRSPSTAEVSLPHPSLWASAEDVHGVPDPDQI